MHLDEQTVVRFKPLKIK